MSLSAAPYKRLPDQPCASTQTGVLNAIYDALTSATYYDASSRTSKVTGVTKDGTTDAVYWSWVASIGASGLKAVMSKQAGTTPRSPDTAAAGNLVGQIVKNAGAYSSYASATPFTTGDEFDNWGFTDATNITNIRVYESDESIKIVGLAAGQYAVYVHWMGALWDPDSTAVADSEYSGRRFGMITSHLTGVEVAGGQPNWLMTQARNDSNSIYLSHNNLDTGWHSGAMTIGSGTPEPATRLMFPRTIANSTAEYLMPSGRVCMLDSIVYGNGTTVIGKLRDCVYIPQAINGTTLQNAGTDIGYVVGGDNTSSGDAVLLKTA
jgi:hypothetical protein